MISETQQEQGTLYALGLLDADEAAAFERELATDAQLRALVRDLRETATSLAEITVEPYISPPPELRDRVLQAITQEAQFAPTLKTQPTRATLAAGKIVRGSFSWVPWALAALLLGCTVLLALDGLKMRREVADVNGRLVVAPTPAPVDVFSKVAFCELEPTPDAPIRPRAAALWDATEHRGVLRISQLAPPAAGKDYQLWAVEAGNKNPVNAGVVHLDGQGHADVAFQPDAIPGNNKVVALALSVEKVGGSPTNQGPILFVGKL